MGGVVREGSACVERQCGVVWIVLVCVFVDRLSALSEIVAALWLSVAAV